MSIVHANQQLQPTPKCNAGAQQVRHVHCAPAARWHAVSRRG
jgi:hypothetical protein